MEPPMDYRDCVIKDGKFIGLFEELYRDFEDPWDHGEAKDIYYDMALYLLRRHRVCEGGGLLFDIGCGKGAFTARLKGALHGGTRIIAIDISPTAIGKAKERYGPLGIDFRTRDIMKWCKDVDPGERIDLSVMSDVMWYVLPRFKDICRKLKGCIREGGHLLMNQTFYRKGEQRYGTEVSTVEEMISLVGMEVVDMVETNRLSSHHAVVLFRNVSGDNLE